MWAIYGSTTQIWNNDVPISLGFRELGKALGVRFMSVLPVIILDMDSMMLR